MSGEAIYLTTQESESLEIQHTQYDSDYSDYETVTLPDEYDSEHDIPIAFISTYTAPQYTPEQMAQAHREFSEGIDWDQVRRADRQEQETFLQRQKIKAKPQTPQIVQVESESESDSEPDSDQVVVISNTTTEIFDPLKVYTDEQERTMTNSKHYRVIDLLTEHQFNRHYTRILFAFKNDTTLTDNQRYYIMKRISNKFVQTNKSVDDDLAICIARRIYTKHAGNRDTLEYTFAKLCKTIKALHPDAYKEIKRIQLTDARRARYAETRRIEVVVKDTHQVVAFLRQIPETDYGLIPSSALYDQYVQFCDQDNLLPRQSFTRLLNKHGLVTKRLPKGSRHYLISNESINSFIMAFQI